MRVVDEDLLWHHHPETQRDGPNSSVDPTRRDAGEPVGKSRRITSEPPHVGRRAVDTYVVSNGPQRRRPILAHPSSLATILSST